MINEQMVTRNGQKGFLDDKGNFYPIADMPTDDAKVTPSNAADQSGGLGAPDIQPPTSANANRDGSRGSGLTDAQIKALQDKANADRKAQQQRGSYNTPPVVPLEVEPYTPPTTTTTSTPTPPKDGKKYKFSDKEGSYNMTKAEINAKYDELRKNPARAKDFGLNANAAIFPNQKIFVDPKTGKRPSKTTASTGGVNPKAGSYAAYQNNVLKNLRSDYGRLPQNTIKSADQRMNKEAYDLVLDYLLSEGHVDTVEEAHYVMLQMTSEHVQDIVEGKYADSVTYVKGTAPVRASYGGKPESFTKETYKKKGKV